MTTLLNSANALSLVGFATLLVLIREIRQYKSAPKVLTYLAVAIAAFGASSLILRAIVYFI